LADHEYDLVVVGSGPAGQKGAIAGAKLGKRVAVVDRKDRLGGVSLHTGTVPSKTLREAILYLTGFQQRSFYGQDYTLKEDIGVSDLAFRVQTVLTREGGVVRDQLRRNGVTLVDGTARFAAPHVLEVETPEEGARLTAAHILVACGTRPARDPKIPFDDRRVVDTDGLGSLGRIPRSLIVVGGGVIGVEYASMFTALGLSVTVIERRPAILDFVDREIVDALAYAMRARGTVFRLGETVVSVRVDDQGMVLAELESGKHAHGEALIYSVGRLANTDSLHLEAAGLSADERGRLVVDEHFRTTVPHIYAAGDVIGFPALASTSMEQGRLAVCHMFGGDCRHRAELLPYGVYTIPEISMVGKTEQELTEAKLPYEVGIARWPELAKGQMLGAEFGLLKILFDPGSLRILGVHAIGDHATEIIHIGQAVLALGGTMEYFRDTVFNYPTLAEAYKVAGLNGLNKVATNRP
jgi:NAD(P) transhydrogenase